jgi:ElaB/YqjD/DUF883 family membrane-anchored ribosome-binding protein
MDNEPEEVIKHQMLETRASLGEKLEMLEQQVVGTVQSATNAVSGTVESVREAVQETVELAKESVHSTVEAVKDTFDLSLHVRRHPWFMMAGSVAVGYLGGCLLNRPDKRALPAAAPTLSTLAERSEVERDGGLRHGERAASSVTTTQQNWFGELGQKFESEINRLKGLALGTMLGAVRDIVASSAPPQIGPQLADIIDSATAKLGGQPINGPVLHGFEHEFGGQQAAYSIRRRASGCA